jgi:LysM repeat protein
MFFYCSKFVSNVTMYYSYSEMARQSAMEQNMPISQWKKENPRESVIGQIDNTLPKPPPTYSDIAKRMARKEKMPISEWKKLNPRVVTPLP